MLDNRLKKLAAPTLVGELGFHAEADVHGSIVISAPKHTAIVAEGAESNKPVLFITDTVKAVIWLEEFSNQRFMTIVLGRVIEVIGRFIAPTEDLPCFFPCKDLYPIVQNQLLRRNMADILDKDEILCNDLGSIINSSNINSSTVDYGF